MQQKQNCFTFLSCECGRLSALIFSVIPSVHIRMDKYD